uniref:Uncharacterized protein n=1 Tax=Amphimedon queenslandica TaxID=400682 RepID=A0A1X7T0N7_AMPQE
ILQLAIKHSTIPTVDDVYYTDKCIELEKCIEVNSTIQEMKIKYKSCNENEVTNTIISIIRGVSKNKTITSLTIQ